MIPIIYERNRMFAHIDKKKKNTAGYSKVIRYKELVHARNRGVIRIIC
jgi:hypothetical protein